MQYRGQDMHDVEDRFDDYDGEEEYDDEDEYGSQSQGQYYYERGQGAGLMGGLNQIEASGASGDYDDEDLSEDSRIRAAHYMRQQQQIRAEQARKQQAPATGFGAGQKPGGFQGGAGGQDFGAMGLGAKAALYGAAGSAAAKPAAGGGFLYGAASGGGSLFGAASAAGGSTFSSGLGSVGTMGGLGGAGGTQFGVPPKAGSGGFVIGGASQFGALGGAGAGLYGASAPADDPYNIDFDLTKIKRTEQPKKTFEEKTSEERMKTVLQLSKETEAAGAKSIIKKPAVAGGKAKGKTASVTFGQCQVYEYDKDSATTDVPKRVETKDISDMRDNRTKMRDQLQEQENKQLENIKRVQEIMREKTGAQAASPPKAEKEKFKSSASPAGGLEDSIAESASLSASADKRRGRKGGKVSESQQSYETDTFEDQSISQSLSKEGSAKKGGLVYWPGAKAMEGSVSVSKDASMGEPAVEVVTVDAMAEYMKMQEEKKRALAQGGAKPSAPPSQAKKDPPARAAKDISESSDKYTDEDFESISKSQGALLGLPKAASKPGTVQASSFSQQSRIVNTYVKKENKFVQTELGKYAYMDEIEGQGRREDRYLERELKEAEQLIQTQKGDKAEHSQDVLQLELDLKKVRMQKDAARHDARNAEATNERLTEKLKQQMHDLNKYKIETEALIEQIDMADAKTREAEDKLALQQAEYDKKLQLQEKQIEFRRAKQDNREVYEMRREQHVKLEELRQKQEELETDLDYFKTKTEKLEVENGQLRVAKGDNKRLRELENEVELLKEEAQKRGGSAGGSASAQASNLDLRNIKKSLTPDEQVQLQREILQLDLMLKGYEGENQKLIRKQRAEEGQIKELNLKLQTEQNLVKELKMKAMQERGEVFVEENNDEVPMMAQNVMQSKAISHKQLEDLHQTVKELQGGKDQARRDMALQADQFKAQISRIRDEKSESEKKFFQVEFLASEKDRELVKLKDETLKQIRQQVSTIDELEKKLAWFRENQKLLNDGDDEQKSAQRELNDLKLQSQRARDDKKRIVELEKKCRLLEETAKSKNPNSIGMLIQAAKTDAVREGGTPGTRELEEKVKQLNYELEVQDKEFERKLRAMRQEQERMKSLYDQRAGQSEDAKQVRVLEEELKKTKTYYNKRIREIEDKYKYGMGKAPKAPADSAPKSGRSNQSGIGKGTDFTSQQEISSLKEQVIQLKKEGSFLAQRAVEAEQRNNNRRNSIAGGSQAASPRGMAGGIDGTDNSLKQDMKALFYQGQMDAEDGNTPSSRKKKPVTALDTLNPFDLQNQMIAPASKPIPDILDILGKINLDTTFRKKHVKINEMYKMLTGDLGVSIEIADLKNLNRFLQNRQSADDDDANYMDRDETVIDLGYLKTMIPKTSKGDPQIVNRLQEELRILKMNQSNNPDAEYALRKAQNLQREISSVENDKQELQQKVSKLESQKSRLEQVFKSTMKGGNMDLIDEVQLLVRRIEFLEEQSEKRSKSSYLESQEPYVREIEMLKSKLMQEREMRDQIVQKKNAEVSYFKAELDALLSEMQNQFKKKQASRVQ